MNIPRPLALLLLVLALAAPSGAASSPPPGPPALVLTAFGTSTKAEASYAVFDAKVREAFPGHDVRWAFTSEVIREKMNARYEKEGNPKRLKSLPQVLSDLRVEGVTLVAVQPLHIFPGEEFQQVMQEARQAAQAGPTLRIEVGETLLHRWERMGEVLDALAPDALAPAEGHTLFVAHGTPTTDSGANVAVLGLERLIRQKFPNAGLGCVDGIIPTGEVLDAARRAPGKRVRIVPLMFVSGDHVMNDLLGETQSWRSELEAAGKTVDAPRVGAEGAAAYKGLSDVPKVDELFMGEIRRTLKRL